MRGVKMNIFNLFKKDFQMLIDDVFYIKGDGVALTGTVSQGSISVDDSISVDNKIFRIKRIEVFKGSLKTAHKGKMVGLILDTEDPSFFRHGLRITRAKHIKGQETS